MSRDLFRTKTLDAILSAASAPHRALRRSLGPWHVTMLGIGAIIGAGIFATVGTAAAGDLARPGAGPSLILSFALTAIVCAFTALCYAEFASMVPISGSAYTYAYATMGELIAWIIGWDLIIEYAVGNVAVAGSWANYFRTFLHDGFNIVIPDWMTMDYRTAARLVDANGVRYVIENAPHIAGVPIVLNLLAAMIVGAITVVLVWGVRESARFNAGMVIVKIIVLTFFIGLAFWFVTPGQMVQNWQPFQPNGWAGTLAGAAVVFFAYIGFDAVSTVAEETRNPARDMPIGIIGSLAICTIFYVAVAAAFTGMLPYGELIQRLANEKAEPLTMALQYVAPDARWASAIVAFGSVVAHTAVLLVFQLGQPRIFFSMARDGLLPSTFAKVHPRFRTPYVTTILTGVLVGGLATVTNIDEMVDLTNIGTLFAFTLVCLGIPVMRFLEPDRKRPFRVPFGPFLLPILGACSCIGLMWYLPPASWWRFGGWLLLGLAVYTAYGYSHSALRASRRGTPAQLVGASLAFLIGAIGLFLIPSKTGVSHAVTILFSGDWDTHRLELLGLTTTIFGTVVGGVLLATLRSPRAEQT